MILVTGGTGFLGQAIATSFGDKVVVLGRSKVNGISDQQQVLFDLSDHNNIEELITDLMSYNLTHIVHAAAVTPWSPNTDYSSDINMARSVVSLSKALNINYVYFLSGWNVYNMNSGIPPYDENTPIAPEDEYGKSKLAVEQLLQEVPSVLLRLSSVYGPGQTSVGLIPNLVKSALTNQRLELAACKTKRDYLYVNDLVSAVKQMYKTGNTPDIINMGSGTSVSVQEVAELIKDICEEKYSLNVHIEYKRDLKESTLLDNQLSIKTAQQAGLLKENTYFKDGLNKYIEWVKNENIL